jgi:Zn-dependent peptidase ImmA (M78 family)
MEESDRQRIEDRAQAILAELPEWLWDGETLPVPIDDIADSSFGLLVRDVTDMSEAPDCPPLDEGQSLSGLLLADRRQIWVNHEESRQWPPRRRFTIAHELGHWVLHRDEQRPLFCRHGAIDPPADPKPVPDARPPLDPIEAEANAFAAALLMPARLMERHYAATAGPDRFERLCAIFGSSQAAMSRRLRQVI